MGVLRNYLSGLKKTSCFSACSNGGFTLRKCLLLALAVMLMPSACGSRLGDDVAALVNERPIMMSELTMTAAPDQELPPAGQNLLRLQLLDQLIEEELLVQEAERRGLIVSEQELGQAVNAIRDDYPPEAFDEMMIREYVGFDEWTKKIGRSILIRKVVKEELHARVRFDHKAWSAFFKQRRNIEDEPVMMNIRHITVPTEDEAEKLRQEILAGADFGDVYARISGQDPEDREGLWITPDRLPDSLKAAVADMSPGGISGVIKTPPGFSIIQVVEIRQPKEPAPLEIMARLRREYTASLEDQAYARWIDELKSQAQIIINPVLHSERETGSRLQ